MDSYYFRSPVFALRQASNIFLLEFTRDLEERNLSSTVG